VEAEVAPSVEEVEAEASDKDSLTIFFLTNISKKSSNPRQENKCSLAGGVIYYIILL